MEIALDNNKTKLPIFINLAILLLPYDALPGTMPSIYKPVSVYFFLIAIILELLKSQGTIKVSKDFKNSFWFFTYALIIGLVVSIIKTGKLSYGVGEASALVLGYSVYVALFLSIGRLVKHEYHEKKNVLNQLLFLIGIAYLVPLVIDLLELLSLYGPLPISIKETIMNVFGGYKPTRLNGTTFETSWLSKHMLFIMPILLYLFKLKKYKVFLYFFVLAVIIFVFTFSLQGIMMLFIAVIVFTLLKAHMNKSFLKTIKTIVIWGFVLSLIAVFFYYIIVNVLPDSYFTSRIKNFVNIQNMMRTDASTFERIGMILASFIMLKEHIIFGGGIGSFAYFFPEIIIRYFPYSLKFINIKRYYIDLNAPGGGMLARVFGEFGILGSYLFYKFLISNLKNVSELKTYPYSNYILFWIGVGIAAIVQDGYASLQFWIVMGYLSILKLNNKKGEEHE